MQQNELFDYPAILRLSGAMFGQSPSKGHW
jgi:hypothetical protein